MRYFLALLLPVCALFSGLTYANEAKSDLEITGAYARATIPGQNNSAAYLLLENKGHDLHKVVKVYTPVAMSTELHVSHVKDGVATMEPLDEVAVKPDEETLLQPGGMHIMLMGLKEKLEMGKKIPLTLTFEDNSTVTLEVPVRGLVSLS